MLTSLRIRNYALIRQLDMELDTGFCVITGETGAGKSILLGALGLVLGQRADVGILFDKEKKCVIEAEFKLEGADFSDFFRLHDLDWTPDELVLRREVLPAGKSRAFINDTPVTLPVLKELSVNLVDIHSQHETLALNRPSFQLNLLDSYLPDKTLCDTYKNLYRRYDASCKELAELRRRRDDERKEQDYRQFLYNELCALNLREGEQREMEAALETLAHAQDLQSVLSEAYTDLDGEEFGMLSRLQSLVKKLKKVSGYHNGIREDLPRWDSLLLELEDLGGDLNRWQGEVELDPRLQQTYEERLDALYRIEKKHQVETDSELIGIRDDLAGKMAQAEDADAEIARLEVENTHLEAELGKLAEALSLSRQQSAEVLQKAILEALAELGMERSRLEIRLTPQADYSPTGKDKVCFLFSANAGSELKEVAKVASGGELSRLMLAIKSVIHQGSLLGTLILDEIDSGVSGGIAGKVAKMMRRMSRYMQVVAITHLPQIAAAANSHYLVYKDIEDGVSVSHIRKLSRAEHEAGVAAMLSNGSPTEAALRAARELIKG